MQSLPHIDEILRQGHRLGVAGDGDCSVQVGRSVAVLAVRNTDHGTGKLPGGQGRSRCVREGQGLSKKVREGKGILDNI